MNQHSKPLKDFTPTQRLQIVNWGSEKLNLPASTMEADTTKIVVQEMEGGKVWLTEVNVNGKIVRP